MRIPSNQLPLDPLLPADIAAACERVGAAKTRMDAVSLAVLSVLAGAFIALGAMFFTITVTQTGIGFGPTQLLGGVAFSLGLILVVIAGAELFTGNTLAVMAWASGKTSTSAVLRSWAIVYVGNFVGALLTVLLVYATQQWEMNDAGVGAGAVSIGTRKVALSFGQAIALGILANALVALAVWLSLGARSFAGKVIAIVFPITAFVAAGFEHSIANMYFIPMALLLKTEDAVLATGVDLGNLSQLTWGNFFVNNLLPVTIGNVIGGAVLVGAVYWFVYLRPRPADASSPGTDTDKSET